MKIADYDQVDLFPTAEGIFREYQDDITWLENRRRSLIIVSICTSIAVCIFLIFAVPTLIEIIKDTPHHYSRGYNRLTGAALWIVFGSIGFAFIQYEFIDGLYRALAKRKCLDIIAKCMKMKYRLGGFFHLVSVYDHHILPPYTTKKVEEGFSGKFKGFRIEFQDFFISPVRRYFDGMGYSSMDTFRSYYGLAMKVQMNKTFREHTVLLPARDTRGFLKNLPNANLFLHEDINLVYNTFTRHYVCLSTNQIEARYIMDPAVMERFTRLAEAFDTDRISASFMGREMVVVMRPVLNLFEVGSLRDPVTVLTIERTLQQVNALRQMATIFELNENAGLGSRVSDYAKDLD